MVGGLGEREALELVVFLAGDEKEERKKDSNEKKKHSSQLPNLKKTDSADQLYTYVPRPARQYSTHHAAITCRPHAESLSLDTNQQSLASSTNEWACRK